MPEVLHGLTSGFAHGRAFSEVVPIANPAVATGFTYTTKGAYWERIASLAFVLTTDSNAANRAVLLVVKDGSGAVLATQPTAAVQVASKAYTYSYQRYATTATDTTNLINLQAAPDIYLQPEFSIVVTIGTVQAGDQISAIRLYLERFDTGHDGYPVGMVTESGRISAVEQLGN